MTWTPERKREYMREYNRTHDHKALKLPSAEDFAQNGAELRLAWDNLCTPLMGLVVEKTLDLCDHCDQPLGKVYYTRNRKRYHQRCFQEADNGLR